MTALGLALLVFGGLVAGCVTPGGRSSLVTVSPEMAAETEIAPELLARFNRYWRDYATGEVEKTFALEAPYIQEMVQIEKYELYRGLMTKAKLVALEIYDVKIVNEFIRDIDCRLTYETDKGKRDVRERRDRWLRVESGWYHVLRNSLLFPEISGGEGARWHDSC